MHHNRCARCQADQHRSSPSQSLAQASESDIPEQCMQLEKLAMETMDGGPSHSTYAEESLTRDLKLLMSSGRGRGRACVTATKARPLQRSCRSSGSRSTRYRCRTKRSRPRVPFARQSSLSLKHSAATWAESLLAGFSAILQQVLWAEER